MPLGSRAVFGTETPPNSNHYKFKKSVVLLFFGYRQFFFALSLVIGPFAFLRDGPGKQSRAHS